MFFQPTRFEGVAAGEFCASQSPVVQWNPFDFFWRLPRKEKEIKAEKWVGSLFLPRALNNSEQLGSNLASQTKEEKTQAPYGSAARCKQAVGVVSLAFGRVVFPSLKILVFWWLKRKKPTGKPSIVGDPYNRTTPRLASCEIDIGQASIHLH